MNYTIEYFIDKLSGLDKNHRFPFTYSAKRECDKLISYKGHSEASPTAVIWYFLTKLAPTPKQRILLALEAERDLRDYEKRKP